MADHTATSAATPPTNSASGKKVLFITPVAPWGLFGGTPIVSRCLIEIFSEAFDLHICCLRSDAPGDYPRTINGASVLTGRVPSLARKLKFFFDFSAESFAHRQFEKNLVRTRLAAWLALHQPGFVILDHIYSAWVVDLLPDSTRVIYIAHDDMVEYADSLLRLDPPMGKKLRFTGLRRQYRSLQEKVVHRADFTLTMTPDDADRLRPIARGPVSVAPLSFEFPALTRTYAPNFDYLLVTGSFDTWEKQLGLTHFLSHIFVPLLRQRPDFRLLIAGRIPAELRQRMPATEPQIRILQAPSDAEMRGAVEDASAAVVLDLQASGLKIKSMELAASGLPLVSWAPGLEGTMLDSGRSCLRADSAAEFIAHLARVSAEPELRRQIGSAARAILEKEFSRAAARTRLEKSPVFPPLVAAGALRTEP